MIGCVVLRSSHVSAYVQGVLESCVYMHLNQSSLGEPSDHGCGSFLSLSCAPVHANVQ